MKKLWMTLIAAAGLLFASLSFAVNINSADAPTLAAEIKGVGEKKAEAIVSYREANGPFKSVDDLANVKGIGAKTVDKNRDKLEVN